MERVLSGLSYPVGLVAAPDGGLLVGEGGSGCVLEIDAGGARRVIARLPGAPMGVARTSSGHLVVADNGGKFPPAPSTNDESGADAGLPALYRIDLDGSVALLAAAMDEVALVAPNGVCVDDAGGAWFTEALWDFGADALDRGSLGYVAADGTLSLVRTDLRFPAALAFDAAGDTLFVSESLDGGIWAFDVVGPGRLGEPVLFASLGADVIPSGIALDVEGRMLVTGHLSGRVHVLSSAGHELDGLGIGRASGLAHIAFGGPDLTTMFIAAAATGEIYATEWDSPGLPLRG